MLGLFGKGLNSPHTCHHSFIQICPIHHLYMAPHPCFLLEKSKGNCILPKLETTCCSTLYHHTLFQHSCMCWLLTYLLIPIWNELRVICIAPAAILAYIFMETLLTSTATANQTLIALIYMPLKSDQSQDYVVCLCFKDIFLFYWPRKKGVFNPFPNKPRFLRVCSTSLLKTLWEKKKLLVTSNFSLSHSVFFSFGELSAIFIKIKIVVWNFFQFDRV